jgi:hypothetical protein
VKTQDPELRASKGADQIGKSPKITDCALSPINTVSAADGVVYLLISLGYERFFEQCQPHTSANSRKLQSGLLFDFISDNVIVFIIRKCRLRRGNAEQQYYQRLAGGHVTLQ